MLALAEERVRPVPPSEPDIALAKIASRHLARFAEVKSQKEIKICLRDNGKAEEVTLPVVAIRMLIDMLREMANGNAVTVIPVHAELTTQQVADFLNVSRPFVTRLLQKGDIKFRKVGTHRRVRFEDLLIYKQKIEKEQNEALAELVKEAQKLDMGY